MEKEFIPYEQALEIKQLGKSRTLSTINDPFSKTTINGITIRYQTSLFSKKTYWYAKVEFKNGKTSGEQYIGDYQTYEQLMINLDNFLNELNNK